jgi:hypothetical protein
MKKTVFIIKTNNNERLKKLYILFNYILKYNQV